MLTNTDSTYSVRKTSFARRSLRRLGVGWTTLLLTGVAIVSSIILTNAATIILSGELAGVDGNTIAIVVPSLLAPLLGALNLRLLFHLDIAEEHLRKLSILDEMTGAANRRHFILETQQELERARRYSSSFSIVFMDIDDFKAINDTHGHLAGDKVLGHLAQIGMQNVRLTDTFARYAGDEFVILMPETISELAQECVERIRGLIEGQAIQYNGQPIHYTISAGVITIDSQSLDLETILMQVDRALYSAKLQGKNQVRVSAQ